MPHIALIHGVSTERHDSWWHDWRKDLCWVLPREVHPLPCWTPITWEPLSESRHHVDRLLCFWRWLPVLRGLLDLAGDLSAVLDPVVQREIERQLLRASYLSDRLAVLAHSLGGVLALQAIYRLELPVRLLVTFGCPVWRADQFPGLFPAIHKPHTIDRWLNIYSWRDWFIGRRPIAVADRNLGTWCGHDSLAYLRRMTAWCSRWDVGLDVMSEFSQALGDYDEPPPAARVVAA